jgi:hypothetical protein
MDWDGFKLTQDERAVLDHVTGLTSVLPEPSGERCKDREIVGELVAMRSKVSTLATRTPNLRLSFDDILAAAHEVPTATPSQPRDARIFYYLSSRWGLGLMAAASVAAAFITGWIATSGAADYSLSRMSESPRLVLPDALTSGTYFDGNAQVQQFPAREYPERSSIQMNTPQNPSSPDAPDFTNSLVRTGSLRLQHTNPADIQEEVLALVTIMGGFVTRLTRRGTGDDATVDLAVAIPSDKFAEFTKKTAVLGEVVSQTETAEDVSTQQIDLNARLAEAQSYLKRLDALAEKQANIHDLQNYERNRREVRLEIERYNKAISALSNRTSYARLDLSIAATAPEPQPEPGKLSEALDDGLQGLESTSAFLVRTGIAGSPVIALGTLIYLALRRKRRKALEQQQA